VKGRAAAEAGQPSRADEAASPGPADTAELRRRIEEVADNILRVSDAAVEEPPKRSRSVG
jgi:hypothetical protein